MDCIRSLIGTILVGANRALLVVLVLLFASAHAGAQPKIRSLTGIIEGHQVGGVTVDLIGNIYVANCRNNSIAKITPDGVVSSFAKSELFNCPNGISFDREGNLYVVNFRDNKMLKVDRSGVVVPFATISEKGLGHLCFNEDRFYVTAYDSHEIYEVKLDGAVKRILGNGQRGIVDGTGAKVRLSFPNGIACNSWARRLYINEYVNDSTSSLPRCAIVREILLGADK
jgi:DNA-binding beta-propeller fold protein YncE